MKVLILTALQIPSKFMSMIHKKGTDQKKLKEKA
jgi:hypothetical protein